MKHIIYFTVFLFALMASDLSHAENFARTNPKQSENIISQKPSSNQQPMEEPQGFKQETNKTEKYTVGVEDILEISVLQPDEIKRVVKVAPDGMISFPYIGSVKVKGLTIPEIQEKIKIALADGYLKYPVVLVSLQESQSRNFFVYGEVTKPGTYPIAENTSVLRAISMAGGFTKFGSSSRVKVLRPKKNELGYETIKIDIKKVMNGNSENDILLKAGDVVVISEGVF